MCRDGLGGVVTGWASGHAESQTAVTPKMGNRSERIHGGVLCPLLDSGGGYSGLYAAPDEPPLRGVTLSLTTNFLSSGDGKLMIAKGYVERRGRGIYFSKAEVWLDGTLLLATAMGSYKYDTSAC